LCHRQSLNPEAIFLLDAALGKACAWPDVRALRLSCSGFFLLIV
jgi:hypothetical protein